MCFVHGCYLWELVSPLRLTNRGRGRPLLWVVRLNRRLGRRRGVGVGRVNRHGRMRCLQRVVVVVASQGRHERIERLTKSRCGIATSRHRHSMYVQISGRLSFFLIAFLPTTGQAILVVCSNPRIKGLRRNQIPKDASPSLANLLNTRPDQVVLIAAAVLSCIFVLYLLPR